MTTDTERLAWLAVRVDYLEHSDKYGNPARDQPGPSGYWTADVTNENWPDTCPAAQSCPDCADKTIFEYIDEMIAKEKSHANDELKHSLELATTTLGDMTHAQVKIERENAELRALRDDFAHRNAELWERAEKDRADAERYRWLVLWLHRQHLLSDHFCQPSSDERCATWYVLKTPAMINGDSCEGYGITPDAAIDAARKEPK